MLIEKRESGLSSVFVLNDTSGMWDCPVRHEDYWTENADWRFASYKTADAARYAMQHGQPNTVSLAAYERAKARTFDDPNAFQVRSIRRRRVYEESGDEVDVDRHMVGHTSPWGTAKRAQKNRSITVGLMCWMTCGNAENDFAENVASGVAMAETLRAAGYMVRVMAVHTAHIGGGERGMIHPLVDFGQPMDEHALMAWGQPAACRHLGFTWMHHLYNDGSMGRGHQTTDAWLELAGIDIFLAKQWSGDAQNEHIAKVLEKIQGRAA